MARRRSSAGTGCLIIVLLFMLTAIFGIAAKVDDWGLLVLEVLDGLRPVVLAMAETHPIVSVGILVCIFANIVFWYKDGQKKRRFREQEERRRKQEEQRLLALKLAEEERQKQLREQEEQRRREEEERRFRALELADVDNMSSSEFEQYVGKLMKRRGYKTKVIGKAGDMGVDIVARNGAKKYAVQVKRYNNQPVSRQAVSDAVAGKEHYGCNAAMVVTNNYFTKGARDLARSTRCQLIDRDTLADWIVDSRKETTKERERVRKPDTNRIQELTDPQLNLGLDSELLAIGAQIAAYHIEAGSRAFGVYAKRMVEELGEKVKPYLKMWYNAVREMPEMEKYQAEMTPPTEVERLSQPEILDVILSMMLDEPSVVWLQEGKFRVENERTLPASSSTPTPPAMTEINYLIANIKQVMNKYPGLPLNRLPGDQQMAVVEQLNRHPLNQKALEFLKERGETEYPSEMHVLTFLYGLTINRPPGMNPEFPLEMLLEPLDNDGETLHILLGTEEEEGEVVGQQVPDRAIEAAQSPLELLELLEGTLNSLGPEDLNRVGD